jgi:uncharacterized protein
MQSKARAALWAAAGYIAIMAAGMAVTFHGFGFRYGDPRMMRPLVFVELVLVVYAVVMARRLHGDWRCGFDRLDPRGLLWMLPHSLAIALLLLLLLPLVGGQVAAATLVVVTTILVGISEEVMFRGVVLRAMLEITGQGRAIILSALCFSVLHGVNLLAGQSLENTVVQMLLTFVFGLAFGALLLRLGSLVPLILFHAAWDMLLFLGGLYGAELGPISLVGVAANALVGLALWLLVLRHQQATGQAR